MSSNLEKYKKDLEALLRKGNDLLNTMYNDSVPDQFEKELKKELKTLEKIKEFRKKLPNFYTVYQPWYSEAYEVIKVVLPSRLEDFESFYKKPKNRKVLDHSNYSIEDYLHGTIRKDGFGGYVVDTSSGVRKMQQQLAVLQSASRRFESSLFDIKQLVQADLFDSELDVAKELNKKGFVRGAGAIAGVVLEKHLAQVCDKHNVKIAKKHPTINDYGQLLKDATVVEIEIWRFVQRLADLRNLCDHDKKIEPKKEQIDELIKGAEKITKTVF